MPMKQPLQSYQGNRCVGSAKVTFGSGGVPSCSAGDNGIPGFNIARAAAGVYSMAFFPQVRANPNYSITRSTGASGIFNIVGLTFESKGTSGAQQTGFGLFKIVSPVGVNQDPAASDQVTIYFYATDSDAT